MTALQTTPTSDITEIWGTYFMAS